MTPVPPTAQSHDSNNARKWEYGNGLYQRVLQRYLDRFGALLGRAAPRRVLDAGCGEGYVQRGLFARGHRAEWTGVDMSPGAVEFARRLEPSAQWEVADLRAMRFGDASFDLVLCSQVLEHIPDPARVRDELARVSARWLLLSVPLEPAFRAICALTIATGVGQDPGHVNFWTPRAFRSFLQPVGRLVAWEWTGVYQMALLERRERVG